MPATSSFAFDEVPEPRLVKNVLEFIGARENIHPLRLWFSSLRGNEKQKMAPVDGELRGLPSTAQVPPAPNATNAVILTVHMTTLFRREDVMASPSILFLCMRTILDTTRRAEHGCRAAVGPAVYDGCVGFTRCCAATSCLVCTGAMQTAVGNRVRVYHQAPDGRTYWYYN
jgi:hypothetical protein